MATTAPPGAAPVARAALVPALLVAAAGLLAGLLVTRWLLLVVLLAPAVVYVLRWQGQQAAEAALLRQQQELAAAEERGLSERAALLAHEHEELRASAPDPRTLQEAVQNGEEVWEGQGELVVRVGTGDLPARSVHDAVLTDVPVTVSLSAAGVLGIGGTGARGLARWLVLQSAVQRSPADLSIWLLTDPDRAGRDAEWGWLRSLPHNAGTAGRCVRLIGATEETVAARLAELQALVAHRTAMASEPAGPLGPDVLVVVDSATIRALPGVPQLLSTGQSAGVVFVCIAELAGALPAECRVTAHLTPEGLELRAGDAAPLRVVPDSLDAARADRIAAALPERAASSPDPLPAALRLLDLLSLDPPAATEVSERWRQQAPVLLGSGEQAALPLDLESGPVLVAGATAHDTTALLRTALAGLALTHAPAALSVVLLTDTDGLADCAALPHVVSAVAGPDGAVTARVLASLAAELDRRQQAMAAVAATDMAAYLAAGHVAVPRLVIVVDEVTGLLPALRDGLLSLAGRGTPLGVHLLLGTSSPGTLSSELLQQVGQRLVLRMATAQDSRRLLGSAAASRLLEGAAGRGYARTGEGPLQPFQAAAVDSRPVTTAPVPSTWEELGRPAPTAEPTGPTDLARIVDALAQSDEVTGASPWLDELPGSVALDTLTGASPGLSWIPWGLEDRPRDQQQAPIAWDLEHGGHLLVVGTRESGRSTLLRTLAASLAQRAAAADVHLYALDGGDGALASLSALPHCGAVVSLREPERAERLLARLSAEVSRRQRQLADRGFSDLAAQRAGTADPLPYLVLVVDAWERFVEAHGWVDDGPLHDALADVLRDGGGVGIRVVLSGDRTLLTSDLAALFSERLALRLDDHADYGLAGLNASAVPVQVRIGRGFRAAGEGVNAVQIAVLPGDVSAAAQNAAVLDLAAGLPPARGRKPFRVDVLPAQIGVAEALALPLSGPGAAFAVGGDELRLQTVNLAACGPGFTISGPAGSGRSTALLGLARSLLDAGTQLCLVLPKASPLSTLADAEGVAHVADVRDPGRLSAVLSHTNGRVAILIDDAEQISDDRWDTLLLEVLKTAVSKDHAVVVAGEQDWLAGADAGFAVEAQRSRSGLLLTPDSPERGDLLGVRLPRSAVFTGPPGRGVLLRSGQPMAVQVPLPQS